MPDKNIFIHPPFSFMNNTQPMFLGTPIETPECLPPVNKCLPLSHFSSVTFQVYVQQFRDALPFPFGSHHYGYAVYPVKVTDDECVNPTNYFQILNPVTPPPVMTGRVYSRSSLAAKDIVSTILPDIPMPYEGVINFDNLSIYNFEDWNAVAPPGYEINIGDCFRLMIFQVGYTNTNVLTFVDVVSDDYLAMCSPCFIRTEECYTTLLSYRCNENSYGFFFRSSDAGYLSFLNRVQLPLYLKNPQLTSEESSYRRSDGTYLKLSERVEEEYTLETDWMPHDWHRKLKIALGCDWITMQNTNIQQQAYQVPNVVSGVVISVVCHSDYEIEWPSETDHLHAKAKTKVTFSDPVAYINSNCG